MTYGPFCESCDPAFRQIYLAEMRALCRVFAGPQAGNALEALWAALDASNDPGRLDAAERALDGLPAKPRRRVLATFAALRREAVATQFDADAERVLTEQRKRGAR